MTCPYCSPEPCGDGDCFPTSTPPDPALTFMVIGGPYDGSNFTLSEAATGARVSLIEVEFPPLERARYALDWPAQTAVFDRGDQSAS